MIVVSNTSPLTNLAAIGQFQVLQELYAEVHIPEAVWLELNANERGGPGSSEVAAAEWVQRHMIEQNEMVSILRRALEHVPAEQLTVVPDCGFSQTARWAARAKLQAMVEGAGLVRQDLG